MPEPITPDTDPDLIRALARACSIAEGSASEERLAVLEGRERRLATEVLDRLAARVATLRAALQEPAEDPDPALVELVARNLPGLSWEYSSDEHRDERRASARRVLSALAADGRLLPPGGEVRTEYNLRHRNAYGRWKVIEDLASNEPESDWEFVRDNFGKDTHQVTRTVTTWSDGSTLFGPWQPVPEEANRG